MRANALTDRDLVAGAILALSAIFAELGWLHARALEQLSGAICGGGPEHCGWCYASLAFALLGAATLASARLRTAGRRLR